MSSHEMYLLELYNVFVSYSEVSNSGIFSGGVPFSTLP